MSNDKTWVDFRHVRETVDFGAVLEAYGVNLKLRGADQHHGFCPLPNHEGEGKSPSFSANLGKKVFKCFGCGSKGNAIDFVTLMEGLNPDHPCDIRQAALLIQERFLRNEVVSNAPTLKAPESGHKGSRPQRQNRPHRRQPHRQRQAASTDPPQNPDTSKPQLTPETTPTNPPSVPNPDNRPRVINAPLDFELKNLDPDHPYLPSRGLTPETIRTFGLGFCSRGLMADRIAIPLRNTEGDLIGYAGRVVDDALISPENPKYRLPGTRERDGKVFEFSTGAFLFNANHIKGPVADLIVVEGFFDGFRLHQCGWTNVVALMGSSCSEAQAEIIRRLTHFDSRIWIMTDGDEGGVRCAQSIFAEVGSAAFIRRVPLEPGEDPASCSPERLHDLLDLPIRMMELLYSKEVMRHEADSDGVAPARP